MAAQHSRTWWKAAALALCGVWLAAGPRQRPPDDGGPLLRQLAAAAGDTILDGPRLTVLRDPARCTATAAANGAGRCGRSSRGAAVQVLGDVGRRLRRGTDSEALHARALIEILWPGGNPPGRAISSLETAVRTADHPAAVSADLAAAYLLRAARGGGLRDAVRAVEAAQHAVELAPRGRTGRYNLALALESAGMAAAAEEEWERYLMLDRSSPWAARARARLRVLRAPVPAPAAPPAGAPGHAFAAYARAHPQHARIFGWDTLLAAWGTAHLHGDAATAAAHLQRAERIGAALEAAGGDATLADAVRVIRVHAGDAAPLRALAAAHRELAAAHGEFARYEYEAASMRVDRIAAAPPPSPLLVAWANVTRAGCLVQKGSRAEARALIGAVIDAADPVRYPALAGRSRWVQGTGLLRNGEPQRAGDAAVSASRLLLRAGERELAAGATYVASQASLNPGDLPEAYARLDSALRLLPPRPSVWRVNALATLARAAEHDGLPRATARIQDERVRAAREARHRFMLAESLISRAQMQIAAGDLQAARRGLREAEPIARGVDENTVLGQWLNDDLRIARAAEAALTRPARSDALLTVVLRDSQTATRRVRGLLARARARLALRQTAAAAADLDSVAAVIARQTKEIERRALQNSLLETARPVFDRLALLALRRGEPGTALRYVELGRSAFRASGGGTGGTVPAMPRGHVALNYVLVGDTLLAWTVSGPRLRVTRSNVPAATLLRTVEDVNRALEQNAPEREVRPGLARLHEWLIRPVRGGIAPDDTLIVVADGEIARVPFAAAYDRARGRYLVQDHVIRYASSLRQAAAPRRVHGGAGRALLVGDPARHPDAEPYLERLPGTLREVSAINQLYGGADVLVGEHATRGALLSRLGGAEVVHFAGHALFDDQRPERSSLVLAAASATDTAVHVTADALEGARLGHVRLFVLSACQTLPSRTGRTGGMAGFTDAVLAAGAGGVVGSQWQVRDLFAEPLMVAFHREYVRSRNPAAALRAAQLHLLRLSDPALANPAAWAAFRYAGN